jgi:glucan phosphorylase
MPAQPGTQGTIAYFSMEIALDNRLPTYSGGLGVLVDDTLRAAADLGLPMVGVTQCLMLETRESRHVDPGTD